MSEKNENFEEKKIERNSIKFRGTKKMLDGQETELHER